MQLLFHILPYLFILLEAELWYNGICFWSFRRYLLSHFFCFNFFSKKMSIVYQETFSLITHYNDWTFKTLQMYFILISKRISDVSDVYVKLQRQILTGITMCCQPDFRKMMYKNLKLCFRFLNYLLKHKKRHWDLKVRWTALFIYQ